MQHRPTLPLGPQVGTAQAVYQQPASSSQPRASPHGKPKSSDCHHSQSSFSKLVLPRVTCCWLRRLPSLLSFRPRPPEPCLLNRVSYCTVKLSHSTCNCGPLSLYLFDVFLERGEGREKERRDASMQERNITQLPLERTPTRNQTHNLGMCPDQESNQQPFAL